MKKFYIIIAILMFALTYINLNATTSTYYFLRTNGSARANALAGCFVSVPNDASAVFYNPASIATVNEKMFSATFLKHILDINSGQAVYVKKIDDLGTFAASVAYLNNGSFTKSDENGNQTGTFGASDLALAVSYANKLDTNLYYGVTLKYIYSYIETANSSAFALDLGLMYLMPDKRTNIGFSILNAGTQISKYVDLTEKLPLDVRIGVSHRLKGLPMMVNFSFTHLADDVDNFVDRFANFSLAGELYTGKYLQLRLGYDNNIRRNTTPSNDKQMSGFSAGAGIKNNNFNFDYGIAIVGSSGYLHRFSVNFDL